jgi:hypothetical protein
VKPALLVAVLLSGCGGGGAGGDCHATADCKGDLECAGVNDGPACGIAPREQCADDGTCSGGRCHAIGDPCSADAIGSECKPACTGDPECGAGFRCNAGACVAVLCNAGFACAPREVCDPARIPATAPVFDRHHGCFAVTCTGEADCGERFCVNGTCQDAVGACVVPMAVP